jgi:hypothetical protein
LHEFWVAQMKARSPRPAPRFSASLKAVAEHPTDLKG